MNISTTWRTKLKDSSVLRKIFPSVFLTSLFVYLVLEKQILKSLIKIPSDRFPQYVQNIPDDFLHQWAPTNIKICTP